MLDYNQPLAKQRVGKRNNLLWHYPCDKLQNLILNKTEYLKLP
ncbi:hypothetical protein RintRC_7403 [Richelia intracellularis]|nr:hypothetical protein RintRC_7403 [Richelia intracellularis]